jgi:tetratricopeptide (TPR) repeat protein
VEAYPTYLFVDANESLLYKSIGSMPAEKFIAEADLAMASLKDEKPLSVWDKEYADGKRGADFLLAYMEKRNKIKMSNAEVLEEYLKTQSAEELSSDKNLILMVDNVASVESKAFETLMQNKEKIMSARGDRRFINFPFRMSDIVRRTAAKATKNQDKALIEKCIEANKKIYDNPMMSQLAEKANTDIYMKFYKAAKDKANFWQTASTYIDKYVMSKSTESVRKIDDGNYERFMQIYRTGMRDSTKDERFQEMKKMMSKSESKSTASELNNAAWSAIELFDDKETLEKVAPWLERALVLNKQAYILDSQAHLFFKMGKKKQAIEVEKEAIELAKAEGQEVAEYEKFLAEMQK